MASHETRPILIVPDAHVPFHDRRAWALMLKVGRRLRPHTMVVIGDLADFFGVSSHSKHPERALKMREELDEVNRALDELDGLGASDKIFVEGNHEDRLRRYLQDKAPELFGVVNISDLLHLDGRGWQYIPYRADTKCGKLHLTHDVGQVGRYSVYRTLDTYRHSAVTGHSHRLAYVVEADATGEYRVAAQFGWLGDHDQIDYMASAKAKKDWVLGFGIGYHDVSTEYVYLVPVPIVNYTCCVHGRLYRG